MHWSWIFYVANVSLNVIQENKILTKYSEFTVNKNSLNSFLATSNYCHLLITFASRLDPDQAQHDVWPDLDPNCLTLCWYAWNNFPRIKNILKTISSKKKVWKILRMQRVKRFDLRMEITFVVYVERSD